MLKIPYESNTGNAAIYLRDCSGDITGIEGQRETIWKWAAERSLEICSEYSDLGFSGNDSNRPGFQQMIRDAEAGRIQTVLVARIDRLSRSAVEVLETIEKLEKHGVDFVAVEERVDTSDNGQGRLLFTVMAALERWQREQIGRRRRVSRRANNAS